MRNQGPTRAHQALIDGTVKGEVAAYILHLRGEVSKRSHPPKTVLARDPATLRGELRRIGGSMSDDWNSILANQTVQTLWLKHSGPEMQDKQFGASVAALIGIGPKDELEGMLAAQLVACYNATMECFRRAMLSEQTVEGRRDNLTQASKLSRTYSALLEALNRHRGKGQQKVTVEPVHVDEGAQAIVGNVEGGGVRTKLEKQPHALGYEPSKTLRSEDKVRSALRVTGDGKR